MARASTANNESHNVTVDQSIDIGANETVAVLGTDGARVGGSETVRVGGNRTVKVSADTSDSARIADIADCVMPSPSRVNVASPACSPARLMPRPAR